MYQNRLFHVIYVWTNKIVSMVGDNVINGCDHYKLSYAILFPSLTSNSTEKSLVSTKGLLSTKSLASAKTLASTKSLKFTKFLVIDNI